MEKLIEKGCIVEERAGGYSTYKPYAIYEDKVLNNKMNFTYYLRKNNISGGYDLSLIFSFDFFNSEEEALKIFENALAVKENRLKFMKDTSIINTTKIKW